MKRKNQSTLVLLLRNLQDKYMNIEANDLSLFIGGTQDATSTHTHTHTHKLRIHYIIELVCK